MTEAVENLRERILQAVGKMDTAQLESLIKAISRIENAASQVAGTDGVKK